MKRLRSTIALAFPLLLLPGCYAMEIDATPVQPALNFTAPAEQAQQVARFETRTTASWLFWGLMPMRAPDVAGELQREVQRAGGAGVASVEIRTQNTFMDGLLSAITLGIYGQRSTFVTGTVIR